MVRIALAVLLSPALLFLPPGLARGEDWPRFRGPTGQGVTSEKDLPLTWSPTDRVAWKVPVPGEGWSSPIVFGDRVYLTTATDGGQSARVIAVDAATGKPLWDTEVFRQETTRKESRNSYATPTPVTDGKRVWAVFGSGGIACVDAADGKPVWTNREHRYYSRHGLGASPVLFEDLLILPFDPSAEATGQEERVGWQKAWDKSYVLAVDANTGKQRWRASRQLSRIGHVTPIVVDVGGQPQLVSPAGDVVQGFDPRTGKLLWQGANEGEGVTPSPVAGGGLVFTSSGFGNPAVRAFPLGGQQGPVKAAWEQKRAVPMLSSFAYADPHLFWVKENGIAVCAEAKTGNVVWQERLGEGKVTFSASPVLAGNRIYWLSDEGETVVTEAGPAFKVLARNKLDDGPVQASMAAANGRLFIRTAKHLWCIK